MMKLSRLYIARRQYFRKKEEKERRKDGGDWHGDVVTDTGVEAEAEE